MAATLPSQGRRLPDPDPRGVIWDLDDLLSIVELAKAVEAQAPAIGLLDNDDKPLPLRVSVGDALYEGWAAHIVVEQHGSRGTYVDFTYEERK